MLTDDEKEFYEKIFRIERQGFRKGFVVGFVIAAAIAAVLIAIIQ